MVVAIHQPEHLPWLGFFHKALQADCLVLLDNVQYRKHYFQNRNRIRGKQGALWLTVPVLTRGKASQPIREVRVDNEGNPRWREKCRRSLIQHYEASPHWERYAGALQEIYRGAWTNLADLNEQIVRQMLGWFSIRAEIRRASELVPEGSGSSLLLSICRQMGAQTYLSGISGRDYLEVEQFERAGIEVRFQDFHHPIYRQRYEPFLPCLSAVDLLFNHGPASREILQGVGVPVMEEVFC